MNTIKMLETFRDLKVCKEELLKKLNVESLNKLKEKEVVMISRIHVIKLLESFKTGGINESELLDWVNIIWFSDVYDYIDEEMDSIASVMNELEEIDEGVELDEIKINLFIESLKSNKQVIEN